MAMWKHQDNRSVQPDRCRRSAVVRFQRQPHQLEDLCQTMCIFYEKIHHESTSRAVQTLILRHAWKPQRRVVLLWHHLGTSPGKAYYWIAQNRCSSVCTQQQISQRCHQKYSRRKYAQIIKPSHFLRKSWGRTCQGRWRNMCNYV